MPIRYDMIVIEREVMIMARTNTRGWYTFEDGYFAWFAGLSGNERKIEVLKHGKIISFKPTA